MKNFVSMDFLSTKRNKQRVSSLGVFVFAFVLFLVLSLMSVQDAYPWWDNDWNLRRQLTFTNLTTGSNLTQVPVLVVVNSSRIDYGNTQNMGEDLRFIDADDSTELSYEIEDWSESGNSYVWVNVPQIDATSSDFIKETVRIDGKHFIQCTFEDVTFVWTGDNFSFGENCYLARGTNRFEANEVLMMGHKLANKLIGVGQDKTHITYKDY